MRWCSIITDWMLNTGDEDIKTRHMVGVQRSSAVMRTKSRPCDWSRTRWPRSVTSERRPSWTVNTSEKCSRTRTRQLEGWNHPQLNCCCCFVGGWSQRDPRSPARRLSDVYSTKLSPATKSQSQIESLLASSCSITLSFSLFRFLHQHPFHLIISIEAPEPVALHACPTPILTQHSPICIPPHPEHEKFLLLVVQNACFTNTSTPLELWGHNPSSLANKLSKL